MKRRNARRNARRTARRNSQKAVFDMLEARTLFAAPAVIGYLTDENATAMISNQKVDWTALTHVNYFSFFPQDFSMAPASYTAPQYSTGWNGGVFPTSNLDSAVAAAHGHSRKINLVIGGWGYGDPLLSIASDTTKTNNFVTNVVSFASAHNVDGIDLDWEPSSFTHADATAYGNLLTALDNATTKELSVAVNPELNITVSGQKEYVIPKTAIAHLNFVNVMAYDLANTQGTPIGSPLQQSITDMQNWLTYGVPASKLIFGVPFYGLSSTNWGVNATYQDLVDTQGTFDPARDQQTISGTTYNFNGQNTIHAKAQWASAYAGGVMIWQIAHDHFTGNALDSKSLLPIIKADLMGSTTSFATLSSGVLTAAATSGDDVFTVSVNGSNIVIQRGTESQSFATSSVTSIVINGGAGDDTLEFNGPMTKPITFNGGADYDTLNVNSGTYTFSADANAGNDALYVSVGAGASVAFNASQHLDGLNVLGTATLSAGASKKLVTNGLTIGAAGKLDLNDNDMILVGATKSVIEGYIRTANHFGDWLGASGIFSSAAKNNATGNTTLGLLSGSEYLDNNGSSTFNGETIHAADMLVKYTYFGDVDFNGTVDVSDYNLIDFGFSNHLSGWANGDADWSGGRTDVSDYNVIDFAFATKSGVL